MLLCDGALCIVRECTFTRGRVKMYLLEIENENFSSVVFVR